MKMINFITRIPAFRLFESAMYICDRKTFFQIQTVKKKSLSRYKLIKICEITLFKVGCIETLKTVSCVNCRL